MAMIKDPAFIAEAAEDESGAQSPIDGEAVRKVIAQMQATPPEVIEQFKDDRRREALGFAAPPARRPEPEHTTSTAASPNHVSA